MKDNARLVIYDPHTSNNLGAFRGGGRIVQLLKEALPEAIFTSSLKNLKLTDTLFIPIWQPFQKPLVLRRYTNRQILMVFDVIPIKFSEHFPVGIKGNLFLFANKFGLRYFDKIITISESSRADIKKFLKPSQEVKVVYPALTSGFANSREQHTTEILAAYGLKPHKYCVYVGDVNWNKNLINLGKTLKNVDIPCIFIGKPFSKKTREDVLSAQIVHPWLREYRIFLERNKDRPQCIFADYLSDNELRTLYAHTLCNILISRDEGFGFSYIEAAHQHTPSILSDIPVFREVAKDTALFVRPEAPDDVAQTIMKLRQNVNLRTELGKKSFERSIFFSQERFRKDILAQLVY